MAETLFTPEQATAALPLVRAIASDAAAWEARVIELSKSYRALAARPEKPQVELNETRRALDAATSERDACAAELVQLGVRLEDPVRGQCDFPAELDGEPVYLCWRAGEDSVEHYHGRGESGADRRPLPVPVTA